MLRTSNATVRHALYRHSQHLRRWYSVVDRDCSIEESRRLVDLWKSGRGGATEWMAKFVAYNLSFRDPSEAIEAVCVAQNKGGAKLTSCQPFHPIFKGLWRLQRRSEIPGLIDQVIIPMGLYLDEKVYLNWLKATGSITDILAVLDRCGYKLKHGELSRLYASALMLNMDPRPIWERLHKMGMKPSAHMYISSMKHCVSRGQWDKFDLLLRKSLSDPEVRKFEQFYRHVMDMLTKRGDLEGVLGAFDAIKRLGMERTPRKETLFSLVTAYAKANDVEGARKILSWFKVMRPVYTSRDLAVFIKAFGAMMDLRGLEMTLELFVDSRLERDRVANAALIRAYGRFGLIPEARDVYELERRKMQGKIGWSITDAMIKAFAQNGYLKEAAQVYEERYIYYRSNVEEAMMCLYAQAGHIEGIERSAAIIRRNGDFPFQYAPWLVYCHGLRGDIDAATQVFAENVERTTRTVLMLFEHMIYSYGRAGDVEGVAKTYEHLVVRKQYRPSSYTIGRLIEAYGHAGAVDRAELAFSELKRWSLQPDEYVYSAYIGALVKNGREIAAQSALQDMTSRGYVPTLATSKALLDPHLSIGDLDKASGLMEQLLTLKAKPGPVPYRMFIDAYDKFADLQSAVATFKAMRKRGVPVDEELIDSVVDEKFRAKKQERRALLRHSFTGGQSSPSVEAGEPGGADKLLKLPNCDT